jgi:hypothetical protein
MKTTRRGLFGILAGAAAAITLPWKSEARPVRVPIAPALLPPGPTIDAMGEALSPTHFRLLTASMMFREQDPDAIREWVIHPDTLSYFSLANFGRLAPTPYRRIFQMNGVPYNESTVISPKVVCAAGTIDPRTGIAPILARMVNLGDGRCSITNHDAKTLRIPIQLRLRCENYAGHKGLHEHVIQHPGGRRREWATDKGLLGVGAGQAYEIFRWEA